MHFNLQFTFLTYPSFAFLVLPNLLTFSPQAALAANLGFENDFDDWETTGLATIEDVSFGSGPTEGESQALVSTAGTNLTPVFIPPILGESLEGQGSGGGFLFPDSQISDFGSGLSPTVVYIQGSAIKTTISVDAGETLIFDYNFLTNEDSSLPISGADLAFFSLDDQLLPLAIFPEIEPNLINSATTFTRETGYQTFRFGPFTSSLDLTLGFGIVDGNDVLGDSGLLIDNIRIESEPPIDVSIPESSPLAGLLLMLGFSLRSISHKKKYN